MALVFCVIEVISRQRIYSHINAIALFSTEKQGDRILFGDGGDRQRECSTTGGAITLFRVQKVEESYSLYGYDWQVSEGD
jgi:hypothetical protein